MVDWGRLNKNENCFEVTQCKTSAVSAILHYKRALGNVDNQHATILRSILSIMNNNDFIITLITEVMIT